MIPRVLVVGDDLQVAEEITGLLVSRGCEARTTDDVDSVLSCLRDWNPDVVITVETLFVNGIKLCRRVRQASNVPIIFMSGDNDGRSEVAALDSGADDYIVKPFSADRLLARVRVALRRTTETPEELALVEESQIADVKIVHSDDDPDMWRVAVNGQTLVGFYGPDAREQAERHREELLEILSSDPIATGSSTDGAADSASAAAPHDPRIIRRHPRAGGR